MAEDQNHVENDNYDSKRTLRSKWDITL